MGFSLGGHAPIFWLSSSWPIPTGALRSVKAVEGQASQAEGEALALLNAYRIRSTFLLLW